MAVAFSKPTGVTRSKGYAAPLRVNVLDVTFSGSYATGGEAITAAQAGMSKSILAVLGVVTEASGQTTVRPVAWNNATGKLQLYGTAAGATGVTEMGAGAYNASTIGRLTFIGT